MEGRTEEEQARLINEGTNPKREYKQEYVMDFSEMKLSSPEMKAFAQLLLGLSSNIVLQDNVSHISTSRSNPFTIAYIATKNMMYVIVDGKLERHY